MSSDPIKKSEDSTQGYRTAFKATAIFGGSQFITILITIARTKLVALWLGPFGMGLMGLFNTAITLIQNMTNLGLQSSAVRDIAKNYEDENALAKTVKAINRWVWCCGIIGTLITIAISPLLSKLYFENTQYTIPFIILSVIVLIYGLTQQQSAILQGMRRLRMLVKANIYGALIGFVVSVPCYYAYRDKGIVPGLILAAMGSLVATTFYSRKIHFKQINQTFRESYNIGKDVAKLGIAMAVSSIMVSVVEFVVRSYIARTGSIDDVGIYTAGWAINAQYLGLVFMAMAKDYFPRLSQKCTDNKSLMQMVNQQGEIAILILSPLIGIMLTLLPYIIQILYSSKFDASVPMVTWLLLGSLIKAGSWSLSYVILAKGASKLFLFTEIGISAISLPLYLSLYHFIGLEGLGIAFAINYVLYFLIVGTLVKLYYDVVLKKSFFKDFFLNLIMLFFLLGAGNLFIQGWNILFNFLLVLIISSYNIKRLNSLMKFKEILFKK